MNPLGAQSQYPPSAGAVSRESGILERVDGVACGLKELHQKLTSLACRISGQPSADRDESGYPPGIPAALSAAETRLRECHQMIDALHKAF
jgi:hypothetical protein